MDQSKALIALQALANAQRLALVRHVITAGDAGLAAGDIGRALGLAASRLSFHLATLEHAGLIRARRDGRHLFYAVDRAGVGGVISHLLNDCCGDHPDVRACCTHAHRDVARRAEERAPIPAE
jgi:ArsR family transcriptional regulator, arsenate/arsenite/antimonite-responsive transcriptional repressor